MTASSSGFATANGALLTVATRWPARAYEKLGAVAIAILTVQLICFNSSSSTKTQPASVVNKFALPPAARRISSVPQPISLATCITASSSPTSPSSSSVTQTSFMPSVSSIRASSSLIMCPFARSFFPPARKMVQQRILPVACLTSMVCAFIRLVIPSKFCQVCYKLYTGQVRNPGKNLTKSFFLMRNSGLNRIGIQIRRG